MTLSTSTIRPGLLVSLKTNVVGGIHYVRTNLATGEEEIVVSPPQPVDVDDEAPVLAISRWETTKRITDIKEYDRATKVRSKVRSLISAVCAGSAFGLLCADDQADKLTAAVEEADKLVREFNARSRITKVNFYLITGRVAADDAEAIRAINSEVRDLLSEIETGLKTLDVKRVRENAARARDIAQVLSPAAQARVSDVIDEARKAAREIVKAGETIAEEVDRVALESIRRARAAFLDLDGHAEVRAPVSAGRAVDFEPSAPAIAAPISAAPAIEV